MISASDLSLHDNSVLLRLFDAEGQSHPVQRLQFSAQSLPGIPEREFTELSHREKAQVATLSEGTPSTTQILSCIENLNQLLAEWPQYASALVNRAQARRMLIPYRNLFSPETSDSMALLMSDLEEAIRMTVPVRLSAPLSRHQSSLLAVAHTHKGMLLLLAADLLRGGSNIYGLPASLSKLDANLMEEAASRELAVGGTYGNVMAQQLSVKINPYAKLCGQIVREAQRQEVKEYFESVA